MIHPHALFILAGATSWSMTEVFRPHLKKSVLEPDEYIGLRESANRFGRPGFRTEQGLTTFLTAHTRHPGVFRRLLGWLFGSLFDSSPRVPPSVAGFVRLMRSLRAVLEVLAREPILVDTGQYAPVFRPRPYQDVENQIANELSQLENFTCRVKLLTGEYLIKTNPALKGIAERELRERIQRVKQHMRRLGYVRDAKEVAEAVEKRHKRLRNPLPSGGGPGRPPGISGGPPPASA